LGKGGGAKALKGVLFESVAEKHQRRAKQRKQRTMNGETAVQGGGDTRKGRGGRQWEGFKANAFGKRKRGRRLR